MQKGGDFVAGRESAWGEFRWVFEGGEVKMVLNYRDMLESAIKKEQRYIPPFAGFTRDYCTENFITDSCSKCMKNETCGTLSDLRSSSNPYSFWDEIFEVDDEGKVICRDFWRNKDWFIICFAPDFVEAQR